MCNRMIWLVRPWLDIDTYIHLASVLVSRLNCNLTETILLLLAVETLVGCIVAIYLKLKLER